MRKGTAVAATLAAGALIAIAVVALLREPATPPARARPPGPAAPGDNGTAAISPTVGNLVSPAAPPTDTGEASAGDTTTPPAAVARLTGRVLVRDEGVAVAGVGVTVRTSRPDHEAVEPRAVTDADGRFTFEFPGTVELTRLVAAAGPATASGIRYVGESLVPPAMRTLDIEVTRGAEISGRVFDERDAPVIGAVVQSFDASPFDIDAHSAPNRETRTDTAGRFTLAAVGSPVTILATAPGRLCTVARSGEPVAGHSYAGVDLLLGPARERTGYVIDDAGAAVAGADLHFVADVPATSEGAFVEFAPWPLPTSSDDAGAFSFLLPVDPAGIPSAPLEVEHPDFATWSGPLPAGDPATIVLTHGQALTGVVAGTDGAPIRGASLRALGERANASTTSGADGSYRLSGLPPGEPIDLYTHAAGHAILVEQQVVLEREGDTRRDITLQPGRSLAGRVTDAAGRPVAGARVGIEGDRVRRTDAIIHPKPTWERAFRLDSALTDGDGRFRIADLYDGAFTLTARAPQDPDTAGVASTNAPDESLELVLPDPEATRIHLVGRISDAVSGAPIEHASFTFLQRDEQGGWMGTPRDVSAPQGQFDLLGPAAGEYQLLIGAEEHTSFTDSPRDWTAGRQRLDVALGSARSLVVQVVRPDGTSVPGASVGFRGEDGASLQFGSARGVSTLMTTGDDGQLRATGLPAQRILVDARLSADVAQQSIDLRGAAEPTLRLVLAPRVVRRLDVAVCLGHKAVHVPADADVKAFHAALGKHHLQPYAGPATLVARDADGNVVAQASASVDGDHVVVQCSDAGGQHVDTLSILAIEFMLTVPPDALTLELTVPGHDVWRQSVPAGTETLRRLATFDEP